MVSSTHPVDQSYLPPVSPPEEWCEIPLFSSPSTRGSLSSASSETSEDTCDALDSETSRKRRRSDSDDEDCERDRKSRRSPKACKECRKAKAKCVRAHPNDETSPCIRCSATGKGCVFLDPRPKSATVRRFAALQKQVEHMEEMHRLLEIALRRQSELRGF